jgi:hypothetical protein
MTVAGVDVPHPFLTFEEVRLRTAMPKSCESYDFGWEMMMTRPFRDARRFPSTRL